MVRCINGSIEYVKILFRSNPILNRENDDKYCFLLSILAYSHILKIVIHQKAEIYRRNNNEINIHGFDFTIAFKRNDVHIFEKLNSFSIKIFELNLYEDQKTWKHNLIPIKVSKNDPDRVFHLSLYKNHITLNKKSNVFLGNHNKTFICR